MELIHWQLMSILATGILFLVAALNIGYSMVKDGNRTLLDWCMVVLCFFAGLGKLMGFAMVIGWYS